MKKNLIILVLCTMLLSCGKTVLNDETYVAISAEVICSSLDNKENEVYERYGITDEEMMEYKEGFVYDEQRRLDIATKILQKSGECLGNK